ncbi:MAG: tetratricopeptide repeat protein [Anaerolineales bacterium]
MALAILSGVVHIVSVDGISSGVGIVVSGSGLIITCSQVIQSLHSQRRNEERPRKVKLYFNDHTDNFEAEVLEAYWHPEYLEDIGVVKIIGDFPGHIGALPFSHYQGFPNASFGIVGRSSSESNKMIEGIGIIKGEIRKNGIRHLAGSTKNIEFNFIGSPVWSTIQNCIIGMVTSMTINGDHADLLIVPTELMSNIFPELNIVQGVSISLQEFLRLIEAEEKEKEGNNYLPFIPSFFEMKEKKADIDSWTIWLRLMDKYIPDNQMLTVIDNMSNWLIDSMDNGTIRNELLSIILKKGTTEQTKQMILSTTVWLDQHPSDELVRVSFMNFVEAKGSINQLQKMIISMASWLKEHPDDHIIRCALLKYLSRKGESDQIDEFIWTTTRWLHNHAENIDVRRSLVRLMRQKGKVEQVSEFILEMNEWLGFHPEDAHNFSLYLNLVEEKGTLEQIAEAIWRFQKCIGEDATTGSIIAQFIGIVDRNGNPEQAIEIIKSIVQWLEKHPEDTVVRSSFLGFVERHGTLEQATEMLRLTKDWLRRHPEDQLVRVPFLLIIERKGTPDEINNMLSSTLNWLKEYPESIQVISSFIGIMKRKGQKEHINHFIVQMDEWINCHNSNSHVRNLYITFKQQILSPNEVFLQTTASEPKDGISLVTSLKKKKIVKVEDIEDWLAKAKDWLGDQSIKRSQNIAFIAHHGTHEQVARLMSETRKWLGEKPRDDQLWIIMLKLVEQKNQPEELQELISFTKSWLDKHQDNHVVRKRFLGLIARNGNHYQIDDVLGWLARWLPLNPQEFNIRHLYLELVVRKGGRLRIEEAVEIHKTWITITELSRNEVALLHFYGKCLQILQRFGEAEKIYRRASSLFYGDIPSKIELAWCLYFLGRKQAAEAELLDALKKASRGKLKSYYGRVCYNLGSYQLKEGNSDISLKYFNEAIQSNPASYLGYLGRGLALMQLKVYSEAIIAFEIALGKVTVNENGEEIRKEIETFLRVARSGK